MNIKLFAILSLLSLVALADESSNDQAASHPAPPADSNLIPTDGSTDDFLKPQPHNENNSNLDITIMTRLEDPCDILCANDTEDEPSCFSDGLVYRNRCVASCKNEKNVLDFKCSEVSDGTCESTCMAIVEKRKCKRSCSMIGKTFSVFCFSDGALQVDSCRAQCDNPVSVAQFNCLNLNEKISHCWNVCQEYNQAASNEQCQNESQDWICASNGLVYAGACRAALMGHTVLNPAQGNSLSDQDACAKVALGSPDRPNSITN